MAPTDPASSTPASPDTAARPPAPTAWEPLKMPVYRLLWGTWLTANICMWMNDVAAAWMMTSLTSSPVWVALVQTASTLPVFLLGLPSGAMADILDRRRYFIITQFWLAATAVALAATVAAGVMTAPLLLALTFANGVGLAMRWPVFSALIPEIVPRRQLPVALALNGVAMNTSRIVGPLLAGALIASAGTAYVFALNAVLSVISGFVIMRWRREHSPSPLGRERLFSAMRVGLQYVGQSAPLRAVFLRVGLFFLHSTALLALLPLLARGLAGGGAGTFTLLLASMGLGAIAVATVLPRLRQAVSGNTLVLGGTLMQSAATAIMALAPNVYVAVPAMFMGGAAWLATANTLSVSAQMALPDWVRARGMSMYQMAIMGGSALGAALWGQVASLTSLTTSLLVAAGTGAVSMMMAQRFSPASVIEEDLTPSHAFKVPVAEEPPRGQIMMTIEYRIDPLRSAAFIKLMQESRRSRLRQGALSWHLLHDIAEPGRFVEQIIDESWTEHLRRFDRITAADVALRERKLGFHLPAEQPLVSRYCLEANA